MGPRCPLRERTEVEIVHDIDLLLVPVERALKASQPVTTTRSNIIYNFDLCSFLEENLVPISRMASYPW